MKTPAPSTQHPAPATWLLAALLALATSVASAATYVHTSSALLHAYPRSNADFSDWATEAVELVEDGSTGIYEADLHRGFGETWIVFTSDPPSAWSEAVGVIELPWEGPYLDVSRDTPYGIQVPLSGTETDIAPPINWALVNCREPDPASRSPAGGPAGTFMPMLPANDSDDGDCWVAMTGIHIPSGQACLSFKGMGRGSANTVSGNGLGTRILWVPNVDGGDPSNDWTTSPMVTCQGNNVTIEGIAFLGRANKDVGSRQALCWVNTRIEQYDPDGPGGDDPIDIEDHPYYRAGFTQDQNATGSATTEIKFVNCAFSGWTVGVQNGGTVHDANCDHSAATHCSSYDTLTFWKNVNSQGVDLLFVANLTGSQTTTMYDFQAGGKASFLNHTPAKSGLKFLNIGRGPGKSDGSFFLQDITFDAGVGAGGYLVYMEDRNDPATASLVTINVRGGHDSYLGSTTTKTSFIHLESNTELNIDGWKKLGPITADLLDTGTEIYRPSISISNSQVDYNNATNVIEQYIAPDWPDECTLRTRNVRLNTLSTSGINDRPIFLPDRSPDGFPILSK